MRLPDLRAEAELRALYAAIPEVHCKGLCQEACGPIGMAPYEAERFATAAAARGIVLDFFDLDDDGESLSVRTVEHRCPALAADGRCGVYDARPVICRAWGATVGMPCPWGCQPERPLDQEELRDLIEAARGIARG